MLTNTIPQPNAQPAAAPATQPVATSATRVFPTAITGCKRLTDIVTKKVSKYQLLAVLPNETEPRAFDLSVESYEAKQQNPALAETIEFHIKECVDKKGKPFTSHWAFMSGFSKFTSEDVAF
jgi:hypothetical protein